MTNSSEIIIIGGGVIGVCSAYYLAERGARVTLLEQGEIAAGSSYGNAGWFVPSHTVPLAAPGVLADGLKWMLDPESPFYIRPRFNLDLFEWILRFSLASRGGPMRRGIPILRDLSIASGLLFEQLSALDGLAFDYEHKGMLSVFKTARGLEHGKTEARLLNEFGLHANMVDAEQAHRLEPALRPDVIGGVHFPDDAHMNPAKFVIGLAKLLAARGVRIERNSEVTGFETRDGKIVSARTSRGVTHGGQFILAAGAWSPAVARDLRRLKIPVQAAKGYSLTVPRPAKSPAIPLMLSEARVAVTPMGDLLRFSGTLELAGLDLTINQRRVDAIARAGQAYLQIERVAPTEEAWRGLRPCTPDGLPILGRTRAYENLIVATGHAMLGMSLGPITGKLVAQIAFDEKPELDLHPLRAERFSN
jgi:D-amino-acid dehydrogenase